MLTHYKKLRFAVITSSAFTEGGDWRSIYLFVRNLSPSDGSSQLVNLGSKRSFRQSVALLLLSPTVIVNGLGTSLHWRVILACLLRPSIALYLHETEYMLGQARQLSPFRFRLFKWIVRRNPLLCVSRQAEALYRDQYGATNTHVIYECVDGSVKLQQFNPSRQHIVMVGSINTRKGVELFSRVADLAGKQFPDWQFHWVGGVATMDEIYRSERVLWHGWHWVPGKVVAKCDLFFLSSLDDPCPLAALEAANLGKRIVAYRRTGTAEVIDGLPGCRVFESYDENVALEAISGALGDNGDIAKRIIEVSRTVSSVEAFAARLANAVG
ncbi:MAG: glycosyltransferase family 4 protein [Verrucomicrobiota bacterium]